MAKQTKGNKRNNRRSRTKGAGDGRRRQASAAVESTGTADGGSAGPIRVQSVEQFERLLAEPEPVIVDFWAPWCGPCRVMGPIFERVAKSYGTGVRFAKVDTEQLPELSEALGVRTIPTLVVLHGSDVIDSHAGLVPERALLKMAERAEEHAQGVTLGQKVKRWLGLGQPAESAPAA